MIDSHNNNFGESSVVVPVGIGLLTINHPIPAFSFLEHYPAELVVELQRCFRNNKKTVANVCELFTYIFGKINSNSGERWTPIPNQTLHRLLGGKYPAVLRKIKHLLHTDDYYCRGLHQCKQYAFTDVLIRFLHQTDWKDFVRFIKPRASGKQDIPNPLYSVSTLSEDENETSNSIYKVDLDKVTRVAEQLFDEKHYETDLGRISAIQTAKHNLDDILSGNVRVNKSDKTGRYYTSITQLQRELRGCLIKEDGEYFAEMDLKCSHAMILLSLFKSYLTVQEYSNTFAFLADENLWTHLMQSTGIKEKDEVKDKFQLMLNGSYNQNRNNPVYDYMKQRCPKFVELLFRIKRNKRINLSNEISTIEASVMHSSELREYLRDKQLKVDIIHDCLWFYGDVPEQHLLDVAQFVLRLFKREGFEMVFTLEVIRKPKQMLSIYDYMSEPQAREIAIAELNEKVKQDKERRKYFGNLKRESDALKQRLIPVWFKVFNA